MLWLVMLQLLFTKSKFMLQAVFSKPTQRYLLQLARKSIKSYLTKGERLTINQQDFPDDIPEVEKNLLQKNSCCFVTLKELGELRGCIGSLEPYRTLVADIIGNALAAAISDPRFPAVNLDELSDLQIEISILQPPQTFLFHDTKELVQQLEKEHPGVILADKNNPAFSATFLPQVWEELTTAPQFLAYLCKKAGLTGDYWKDGNVNIQTYQVENFAE
jgi:uncharacterized protein